MQEYDVLMKSCDFSYDTAVYVCADVKNMTAMWVLITGPKDTPYSHGCYIFDVFLPNTFPNSYPMMTHVNNGNRRFNPNLYANGKVCLSLLGTWGTNDGSGECWNESTSTLSQVFKSIQSLILIDEPYFNEPGYESSINTPNGKNSSKNYNIGIRYYNMCYAIHDMLSYPDRYPEFKTIMQSHFRLKKMIFLKLVKNGLKN